MSETLRPDLSHEELKDYFLDRLPSDLSLDVFGRLACGGYARLIVQVLGGSSKARIWWIPSEDEVFGRHYYVIPDDSPDRNIPYNSYLDPKPTIGYVRQHGVDETDECLREPWERLG